MKKNTVDSIVELGMAIKLYGWILEKRNAEGDLEEARDCYLEMQRLREAVEKEYDAKTYKQEFFGTNMFLARVERKLKNKAQ